MENYENIYNTICRVCLRYSDSKKMVTLIDNNKQDGLTSYAKAASTFSNIILSKQDGFPSNMCLKCLSLLKQAIHFKLMAESSDKFLKLFKNSVGSDIKIFQEKIVEYTMLKFYFPNECFKTRKECSESKTSSKTNNRVDSIKIQFESDEKEQKNKLTANINDDEIFDTFTIESDTDQNTLHNKDQLLENTDKLGDSYMHKSQSSKTSQEVLGSSTKTKVEKKKKKRNYLKRNLVCNVCNKVMAHQVTLRYHLMRHNGGRFICEHCGKRYPVYNELQIHQLTKHGTGPFLQCPQCPFKAPGKIELTEHKRIHTGERPFACDKCGLTFRRQAIWRKHLVHHSEKKIQCPYCPKRFYLRSDMIGHLNSIHERLYVYICSECGAKYNSGGSVRQHMVKVHGIPREKQGKITRIKNGATIEK